MGTNYVPTLLGYTYDSLGNLKSRADAINSVTETFAYDALNRLTSVSGPAPKTYAYDSIGNITSKSDIGTYTYGAKPHAVSTTATAGVVNASYGYDANGNMTSASYGNNNGRYFTYTSFNKIGQFQRAGSGSVTGYVYDAYHERMVTCGSNSACTVYLNPYPGAGTFYEKVLNTHTHYIHAGATPVAIYTLDITNPTPVVRYLHKDHLGSIDAITNATGAVVERFSYDAFGKLRLTNGQDSPSLLSASRGYTGHEHYWGAGQGLINMNGRVYDPSLARFTSADPYIHNPSDSQELNRYSYVTNNPLKYTDPTGYKKVWQQKWFRETVKVVVAVVAAAYTGGAAYSAFMGSAISSAGGAMAITGAQYAAATASATIVSGMASGAVAGGIMGNGSLKGAVGGATTGMLFGAVNASGVSGFSKVLASGTVGGITTDAQGGRFEDGFKMSGITSSMNWGYEKAVNFGANPLPGENLPGGAYSTVDAQGLPAVPPRTNVFGKNVPLTGDFWTDFDKQGGFLSKIFNSIPTMNPIAAGHDQIFNKGWLPFNTFTNYGTMLPAAVVTYGALLDGPIAVQLAVDRSKG
ncbi:MAG: hypothetical protein M3A44_05110 [Gammaproteobacteria bacterium]